MLLIYQTERHRHRVWGGAALPSAPGMSPRYHGNRLIRLPGDASAWRGAQEQWAEDAAHQTGTQKYPPEPRGALRMGFGGSCLSAGEASQGWQPDTPASREGTCPGEKQAHRRTSRLLSQAPSRFSLVTHAAPSSWNTLPFPSSPASPPVPVSSLRSRSDPAGGPSRMSPQALPSPVRASHRGCRCDSPPVRPPVPAVSSLRADARLPLQLPGTGTGVSGELVRNAGSPAPPQTCRPSCTSARSQDIRTSKDCCRTPALPWSGRTNGRHAAKVLESGLPFVAKLSAAGPSRRRSDRLPPECGAETD